MVLSPQYSATIDWGKTLILLKQWGDFSDEDATVSNPIKLSFIMLSTYTASCLYIHC